jgi:methionyl-tRNA formyltransferase
VAAPETHLPTEKPLKAVILATPDSVAAGLVAGWLRKGHRVDRIYLSRPGSSEPRMTRDRQLGSYCPNISLHAQAERARTHLAYLDGVASWNGFLQQCRESRPDVVLSLLFMARIPAQVLSGLECPVLNVHPALLPAYRGASPITSMVIDGTADECAGMTLHVVTPEFDTGGIVAQAPVTFAGQRHFGAFLHGLIQEGVSLLTQQVPAYLRGEIIAASQEPPPKDRVCYPKSVFTLTSAMPSDLIRQRVDAVGPFQRFKIQGLDERVGVDGFIRNLGPPTGEPPREGWHSIEMDAADARVRLRKSTYLRRYLRRLFETRRVASLQRQET